MRSTTLLCVVMLSVGAVGCQTAGSGKFGQQPKSVAAIAQESLRAAEFGQFQSMGDPNASAETGRRISTTTRVRSPRRKISRRSAPRSPASRGPNGVALIDEIFDQTDIREALQAISTQAEVSIIVDDQVAGTVTALIQNEPLEQALQKILLPLGHHYRVVNGQYLVCGSDPDSPMFSMISDRLDYTPVFASPKELVELLSEKNQQFVRIAPKRNMIIVEAPTKIANQIDEELRLFDRPVPQVVLEAMVVVVSPDSGFKFGTNVGQGFNDGESDFNFNLDGLELSGNVSGGAIRDLFSNFALTSFFVRALEQEGYLSIRATPHVMAKNGEKAEISIARESFFSTQPLSLSAQTFFRQDIQKVEAGISLIITPTIRGDNVTMVIEKAEVSEDIRATVNDPAVNNPYPLINRRQVSTTVHVEDGETVVIGGLMQNQMVDRVSRVPVLGDIPLLGRLFTQVVQEEEAAEVVVFISPRIVRTNVDHPMAASVPVAQTYDGYCYQRMYPRDNGLQIGGPVAPAQVAHAQVVETHAVPLQQAASQPVELRTGTGQQLPPNHGVPSPQISPQPPLPAPIQPPQIQPPVQQSIHVEPVMHMPVDFHSQPQLQSHNPHTLQNHIDAIEAGREERNAATLPIQPNQGRGGSRNLSLENTSRTRGNRKILRARPAEARQSYRKPDPQRQTQSSSTSARIVQTSALRATAR